MAKKEKEKPFVYGTTINYKYNPKFNRIYSFDFPVGNGQFENIDNIPLVEHIPMPSVNHLSTQEQINRAVKLALSEYKSRNDDIDDDDDDFDIDDGFDYDDDDLQPNFAHQSKIDGPSSDSATAVSKNESNDNVKNDVKETKTDNLFTEKNNPENDLINNRKSDTKTDTSPTGA